MTIEELRARLGSLPGAQATAQDFGKTGTHVQAVVPPAQLPAAAQALRQAGFALETITGIDWMAEGQMEAVYDFVDFAAGLRVTVRARAPRDAAEFPTIRDIFQGADWHEREAHDFFGIPFTGRPPMEPLLLPEDATFHPLRKDYAP